MKKPDLKRLLDTNPVTVCLLTLDEPSRSMAEKAVPAVAGFFRDNLSGFSWEFVQSFAPEDLPEPVNALTLLDKAYLAMLDKHWDFCFVVTGKKLESRQSRTGLLKISPAHAAGVISLEPLEPLARDEASALSAFAGVLIEGMLRLNGVKKEAFETVLTAGASRVLAPEETARLRERLCEVARILPQEKLKETSRILTYLRAFFRHPLRVFQTVLSNHPWTMVTRSTRIIFAALATMLLSIVTMEFWDLALGQRPYRTVLMGVAVIVMTSFYVTWKHHLLIHRSRSAFNEQVAIFNLATIFTVIIGFSLLFATIFSVDLLITMALFPRKVLNKWLMLEHVGFSNYVRASLLVSNVALLVGALGAGLEESSYFRFLLYGGEEE